MSTIRYDEDFEDPPSMIGENPADIFKPRPRVVDDRGLDKEGFIYTPPKHVRNFSGSFYETSRPRTYDSDTTTSMAHDQVVSRPGRSAPMQPRRSVDQSGKRSTSYSVGDTYLPPKYPKEINSFSDFSFRDDDGDDDSSIRNPKHPHLPAWANVNSPGKTAKDYLNSLTERDVEIRSSPSSRDNRTPTQLSSRKSQQFRETYPVRSNNFDSNQAKQFSTSSYETREFTSLFEDQNDIYDNADLLSDRSQSPESPRHKRLVSSSSLVPFGQGDLINTLRSSLSNISDQVTKLNQKVEKVLVIEQEHANINSKSKVEVAASTIQKAWKNHVRRKSRPLESPLPIPVTTSNAQTNTNSDKYADREYVRKLEKSLKLAVERIEALETHMMSEKNERQKIQTRFDELQSKIDRLKNALADL